MKKIKKFFDNLIYSIRVTKAASKKYFYAKFGFSLLLSLVPFVSLILWKNIINALTDNRAELNFRFFILTIIAFFLIYIITTLLERLSEYTSYKYNDRINVYVESVLLDKFASVDLSFFDSSKQSDKLRHTFNTMYSIINLTECVFNTLKSSITFIIAGLLLIEVNFFYAVLVVLLSIPTLIIHFKVNNINYMYSENVSKISRRTEYFKGLFSDVDNLFDIKLFDLKEFFIGKYIRAWKELYQKRKETTIKVFLLNSLSLFVSSFVNQILLYIIIIGKLSRKVIKIGDAVYFISVFNQFYDSTDSLVGSLSYTQYAFHNLSAVKEFLDMEIEVQKSGKLDITEVNEIEFSHVCFKYPNSDKWILNDCSFKINKRQTIGLVGENGAGKSTIVKLLLRLYDVQSGQILVNGIDIREYDIIKYRSVFGALFQDYNEYSLTLRENVGLSDYSSIDNDEKIYEALEKSELISVVKDWPLGLETPLTKQFDTEGKELSGGQWQRIALARLFFAERDFVILDEPSASLDAIAEEKIFRQFRKISSDHSCLIISHRLSSIRDADMIIVLKDGKVAEQGNHRELMERNGYYAEMFNLQAAKYISEAGI